MAWGDINALPRGRLHPLRSEGAHVILMRMTTLNPTSSAADGAHKPADRAGKKRMVDLWGESVMETGYTVVPTILLWGQARLELSNPELAVLVQLISHRWTAEKDPHPSKDRIATRIGRDPRTVQRLLTALEKKGLLTRVRRSKVHKGQDTNGYDLSGLVGKLNALAPEFKKVLDQERIRRAAVERPKVS